MFNLKKVLYGLCCALYMFASLSMADPGPGQGHGFGHQPGVVGGGNPHITSPLVGSHPPGLTNTPYGLMKQNKTPKGWSRGLKKGWSCQNGKAISGLQGLSCGFKNHPGRQNCFRNASGTVFCQD